MIAIGLFVLGIVIAILDHLRDIHGGSIGRGCLGIVLCLCCWMLAAGVAIGELLASIA